MWPNTACRWRVIRILKKKGYDVFYENMVVMPSNCLYRYSDHLSMRLLEAMPRKSAAIADDILAGNRRRKSFPLLSWPVMFLCSLGKKSGSYWKNAAISAQCTSCGKCAGDCPQDNITMKDGRPVFGAQCILCLRCYYGCPVHAISPAKMRKLFF
jgi:Coenzyme F420-reducing hydrogenase, beta subunit